MNFFHCPSPSRDSMAVTRTLPINVFGISTGTGVHPNTDASLWDAVRAKQFPSVLVTAAIIFTDAGGRRLSHPQISVSQITNSIASDAAHRVRTSDATFTRPQSEIWRST
jgi:hypothetical protein